MKTKNPDLRRRLAARFPGSRTMTGLCMTVGAPLPSKRRMRLRARVQMPRITAYRLCRNNRAGRTETPVRMCRRRSWT